MASWYFSQIFQISYFKEHLMATSQIIWKSCCDIFVLRSGCSELADNCPEKSEKTPRKTSVEIHFLILGNKKHSPIERFPGKFFERLSAEIHWEGCHFVKTWDVLQC